MQQRIIPGHGQLVVGEGELGVVLGRRRSDEIGGQVAGLVTRRQGTNLIRSLKRIVLAPVLRVAAQLRIATQIIIVAHAPDRIRIHVISAIDQVHVWGDIGTGVVLLLLLLLFMNGTVLALGTAPGIRRIEAIFSWNVRKRRRRSEI